MEGSEIVVPRIVTVGLSAVAGIAGIGTLVSELARLGWPFELASHFRVQYAWLLFLSAGLFAGIGHLPVALLALGGGFINLALIAPLYAKPTRRMTQQPCRALLANVLSSNRAYERLRRVIREANPDVIVLTEVTQAWLTALEDFRAPYPFTKVVVLDGGFGIAVMSRLPFEHAEATYIGQVGLPSIVVRLSLHGRRVTLVATHPLAPLWPSHARLRNQQLAALAEYVRREHDPVILLGDLNTTSWSPVFQDLIRHSRLRDSRVGFGVQPSCSVATALVQIPIDHCLVSSEVIVHHRQVGPNIGSDHSPIIVDFSIEEREVAS